MRRALYQLHLCQSSRDNHFYRNNRWFDKDDFRMKIAVTGANGFVGQALCPHLQKHFNAELITLTRNPSNGSPQALNFAASNEELITALQGVDCLIHLAARAHSHQSTSSDFERDNIALSERVARLCVAANIPRLIYLSSIKVNGNSTQGRTAFCADEIPQPDDIYGQSKLASELALKRELKNSTAQWVIIRPPLVYGDNNKGNLLALEKLISKNIPLPFGQLTNQRDLVSIENLCSLITLTITHPLAANETFLVSDGISRSTKEIVQLLAAKKGTQARFFKIPNSIYRLAKLLKPDAIERLTGDLQVDITKTKTLLGWNPYNT